MKSAFHPSQNRKITIEQYIKEFGRKVILEDDNRPRARCPICEQSLNDVGGRSESSIGHFSHFQKSGYCPTKASAALPFKLLAPTTPNKAHASYLKKQFLDKWKWHYSILSENVPFLSYQEFIELIKEANRLRIWEYAKLIEQELPYTLMLLNDFPVNTSYKLNGQYQRKYWLRFFYDTNVKSFNDLWIKQSSTPKFFRASYLQPTKNNEIPNFRDMINLKCIKKEDNFLARCEPKLPAWLVLKLNLDLPKYLNL